MSKQLLSALQWAEQRFWSYVDKRNDGECWLYKGYLRKNYGQFRVPGFESKIGAHQASFLLSNHYLPPVVRHKCDNPPCCNPKHLIPGTQLQNVADCVSRDRHARGERNKHAKLTENDVRKIRAEPKVKTNIQLSKEYGVHHSMISLIRLGRAWRHVI